MVTLPIVGLVTHTRKVQSLYKRALRNLECWHDKRHVFRYHAVLMRQRFEENRPVADMRVANSLLIAGEEELFQNLHYCQRKFPESPGGVAYERTVNVPDWILDYWHPLEKLNIQNILLDVNYRKKQFIEQWERKYGKSEGITHH